MSCDKIQKITEALYRVTELYSDKEPLKWQLRTAGLELFDFLTFNEEKEIFDKTKVLDLIQRLEKFLQLAYASSAFVANINFEVLRREYLLLADSIQSQIENRKHELFTLESVKNLLPLSDTDSNGHPPAGGDNSNGQSFIDNGHNGQEGKESEKPKELKELKERQKRILDFLKKDNGQKWFTVRDVSVSLPEYGEKSIQRDFLEMVDAGILKKTGDKRWRKYCLEIRK